MSIASQGIGFGAFTPNIGGDALETINAFEARIGRRMDIVNEFRKWGGATGDFAQAKISLQQSMTGGRAPMISWEPLHWDSTPGPYTLERIVAGEHDAYITGWATGLRDLKNPAYLRPMHEMNGNWYHWSGNPKLYQEAWWRIRNIFNGVGATNVKFIWCVNVSDVPGTNRMENYWPGREGVDILGIDGYNAYTGWRQWPDLMRPAYTRLCALDPDLPVWVCETASPEASPAISGAFTASFTASKPSWIQNMFSAEGFERVRTICWFDQNNIRAYDWRIDTSRASLDELKRQLRACEGWVAPPHPYIPPVPTGVTVTRPAKGQIKVSWKAPRSFVRGYRIMQRQPGVTAVRLAEVLKPTTAVTLDVEPGVEREYSVVSFTAVRASAGSPPIACTA